MRSGLFRVRLADESAPQVRPLPTGSLRRQALRPYRSEFIRPIASNAAIILTVEEELVKRLLALNREFYAKFAESFSETRSPGRINLVPIAPFLHDGMKVLDAGCGNGRLAERLDRDGFSLTYIGIDLAPELIEIAKKRKMNLRRISAEFHMADVTTPEWTDAMQVYKPFDLAFALAILHHIPGLELRLQVLRGIHSLLRPGGVLLMSNWQFMQNERLRRKILPWQTLNIDENQVEPGDALIDWKRGGESCRYVHEFTAEQVQMHSDQSGFRMVDQFCTDADQNLFSIMKREG